MPVEIKMESDLESLLGESETIELEFKGPEDFLSWPEKREKVADDLSKEVSAFANTYGGQIIIGLKETRHPPRKAEAIVGLDPRQPPVETLQRLIESNVRPRLEGIRYWPIPLGGNNEGRVVYVITVPQGKTAYQARDKLYYGRSEYECVPLEDQLIRYKMIRERIAEATIAVVDITVETAQEEFKKRRQQLENLLQTQSDNKERFLIRREHRAALEAPPRTFDRYGFLLSIKNTGPITMRDCALSVEFDDLASVVRCGGRVPDEKGRWVFRLAAEEKIVAAEQYGSQTAYSFETRLFPLQEILFPGASFVAEVPIGFDVAGASLRWALYLDDSPALSGSVQLGELLRNARSRVSELET